MLDLYDGKQEIVKNKELIIVPTTCGTGSEVTNIAVLSLNARGTKKGLAHDAMYGDYAVLIPELLKDLPFKFFATTSIDAAEFADSVIANQQRLMANNFVFLDRDRLIKIHTELF